MQESETRWKSMLDTLEAEANDKLLRTRSCSCSCGQQCKTDAIETEDLQINSELAQIRNERDNLKKQETLFQVGETFLKSNTSSIMQVFKKILTGMDAKIRFYYYERKEAGWISFGKNVLEATMTLFCARGGTLLATKAH
ncbi:hypothetical protein SLEP1_g12703 [Rubroshorea leprosula]|uniref:Uncharacterized protein n=1 Tax=Rubroshorea leprosula TaxID=152421 RepID=A0AAV5IJ45_9ROSI|nr:hypothetical protein SLEP1_g12703 [Rubroshorea leprosula]